mgnify:CR=1 FL=1
MNDKEFAEVKAKIKALVDKWVFVMGLKWYEIDIAYKMGDAESRGDGFICTAMCHSRWMYRSATLTIWVEELPEDPYKLEKLIVHELCHILVEPMRGRVVTDKEEYVVESLARAFMWTDEFARPKTLKPKSKKKLDK